jgi:prophage tail gpP-like protein
MSGLTNGALAVTGGNQNVSLTVGGQEITGFTSGSFSLSAESTEQSANLEMFCDSPPDGPVYPQIKDGEEAVLKVFGFLTITGELESRSGEGDKNSYKLTFSIKSKGKRLQKATAKINQGQDLNTNPKKLITTIAKNAGCEVEFGDVEEELIKQHICVGNHTSEREIRTVARDRGYLVYEKPDGKLRVEGDHEGDKGCDLVVGQNVMKWKVSKSSDKKRGKIKIVGTRNLSKETNRAATLTPPGEAKMKTSFEGEFVIWADGDQTPDSLRRRARFEKNRREAESVEVTLTTFSLVAPDGQPWKVNGQHYVEVPSESVSDSLRLKSIEGSFDKEKMECSVTLGPIKGMSNKDTGDKEPVANRRANKNRRKPSQSSQRAQGRFAPGGQ